MTVVISKSRVDCNGQKVQGGDVNRPVCLLVYQTINLIFTTAITSTHKSSLFSINRKAR